MDLWFDVSTYRRIDVSTYRRQMVTMVLEQAGEGFVADLQDLQPIL
jgi:hypothetical protein